MLRMVIAQKPKSQQGGQAAQDRHYQRTIAMQAQQEYAGPVLTGALYARIVWFHRHQVSAHATDPDLDNVVKPVLDALKGIVFDDDHAIVRCAISRHRMDESRILDEQELPRWLSDKLYSLFFGAEPDVIYVGIAPTRPGEVILGAVDGVSDA